MTKMRLWVASIMVLILVGLTGCQAVGGFDVNKALLSNVKQVSGESKMKLGVEVVPGDGTLTEETKKVIELINSIKLNIDSAKVQDAKTLSVKGSLDVQENKLPFHLSLDKSGMAVTFEGAKQPLYIPIDYAAEGMPDMTKYEEQAVALTAKTSEFFLKHLSNPKNISAKQVQGQVNGETLSLTNLHVEINGEELLAMVKPFLESVSKDDQGLKDLISSYYDVIWPIMESMNESEDTGLTDSLFPVSKEMAVTVLHTSIKEGLAELLKNYDESLKTALADTPELATVLGKDTVLKMDLYFDSKMNIRKETAELNIAIPQSDAVPIKAVKVSYETEQWNLGGNVTADKVDISAGALDVISDEVTPGKFLRNLKEDSYIYKLFKNDLKIGYKYILLDPLNDYYGVISKKNTTFVPLRYVSEELDAEVKWTKGSKQIVIIDDLTGQEIVLNVGSNKAVVGGKSVTLASPVFVHKDGSTYVPLRFIAESLGAVVEVDSLGWITIERN